MIELIYAAVFLIVLSLILLWRVAKGPSVIDRAVAGDSIELMASGALMLFAVFSGRSIYLDVAIVLAMLSFISAILIAKYLERSL